MTPRRFIPCFAVALFALAFSAQAQQKDAAQALVGAPAPDFALDTTDGSKLKLSELKGNVVLLDFWATWCHPCRKSMPHLQALQTNKEFTEKGLKVLAVNAGETKDVAKAYMNEHKFTFAVPLDTKGVASNAYRVSAIPTTVVVGRDGTVKNVFVGYGPESDKQIDAAVVAALKEEKPK